jgi:hypothetical protein
MASLPSNRLLEQTIVIGNDLISVILHKNVGVHQARRRPNIVLPPPFYLPLQSSQLPL